MVDFARKRPSVAMTRITPSRLEESRVPDGYGSFSQLECAADTSSEGRFSWSPQLYWSKRWPSTW
jgi:hypothetical protein